MLATYASTAAICLASLLVGRAILSLSGQRSWSWLEPAVGFGAILTVTGLLASVTESATAVTLALVTLLLASGAIAAHRPYEAGTAWREGLPVALVLVLALSLPFATSGHWGLLGASDLRVHLEWAEWLRDGLGSAPPSGFPLGPHGLAAATASLPGIGLEHAFLGELFAITAIGGLTALGAIRHLEPARRTIAAILVALPYLIASFVGHAAFRATALALFILTTAVALLQIERRIVVGAGSEERHLSIAGIAPPAKLVLAPLAVTGGVLFSSGLVGLIWPLAIAGRWSLNRPQVRSTLRKRPSARSLPLSLGMAALVGGIAALVIAGDPFDVNEVTAGNALAAVSPIEAFGIWPSAGSTGSLTVIGGAVAIVALVSGLIWWLQRRESAVPVAFGVSLVIYLLSPLFSSDYSSAQALAIVAPLAMLVAVRPLLEETSAAATPARRWTLPSTSVARARSQRLGWAALAIAFLGGAAYSSVLALSDAPVAAADRPSATVVGR